MFALYFSSVDLVSFVQLLPFTGQSVNGQSVDAIGCRPVRARRDRGELPLLDSGAVTRKAVEELYGMNTVLNINSALFYCVNCFTISQV